MAPPPGSAADWFLYPEAGYDVTLQASVDGRVAATATVRRQGPLAVGVAERLRPAKGGIDGNLYLPKRTTARRPAVLLFGGSEGGLTTSIAAALLLGAYFPQLVTGVIARGAQLGGGPGLARPGPTGLDAGGPPAHGRQHVSVRAAQPTQQFAYLVSALRDHDAGHLVGGLTAYYGSLTDDALTSVGGTVVGVTVAGTQAAQADAHTKVLALPASQ